MKPIETIESDLSSEQVQLALDAYEKKNGHRPYVILHGIGIPTDASVVMVSHKYEGSLHMIVCWSRDKPRKVICDDISK